MSHITELLYVSQEEERNVKKFYGKTEEDIKDDVKILLDWLNKQPHLPKTHDEARLERFLLRNKFRIEQAKTKQDNYYTYRGLYPEFFQQIDPNSVAMRNVRICFPIILMPKLLPNLERLCVLRLNENQDEIFNMTHIVGYVLSLLDLQLSHDYGLAETFVLDCSHLTLKYILKIDPLALHKALLLHQNAFSGRITHIDFVNIPPVFDILLALFKRVFDAKLFGKIRTHKNFESLYDVLPREYLPKELGGDQESMYEIHDKWGQELIVQEQFLKENAKRISDEKLRVEKFVQNELFGVEGTFRKINLD